MTYLKTAGTFIKTWFAKAVVATATYPVAAVGIFLAVIVLMFAVWVVF